MRKMLSNIKKDLKQLALAVPALLLYTAYCMFIQKNFCPLAAFTGFPCPGCGGIRTVKLLFAGHFLESVQMNPTVYLWFFYACYCFYFRYIRGARIPGGMKPVVALCLVMCLFYVVRMYLYFPDRRPYVFLPDNWLNRRLPGYSQAVEAWLLKLRG